MGLVAFDLEIAKAFPDGDPDWLRHAPLGIACAAFMTQAVAEPLLCFHPEQHPDFYDFDTMAMNRQSAAMLVDALLAHVANGDTLVTWNGLSFDFHVLAIESGRREECATLAMGSIDMMFWLVCQRGHPLALDTALAGMGLTGKIHEVPLSDGEIVTISGRDAPALWQAGEYQAVLTYCGGDVRQTLELAIRCQQRGVLAWSSQKGRPNQVPLGPRWPTVRECLELPVPDTSWMTNPLRREDFVHWIVA